MSQLAPFTTNLVDTLLEITCRKLQLSSSQYDLATSRYQAVGKWLLAPGSRIRDWTPTISPQGSLNLGTTNRPVGSNEFDLDLMCLVQCDPHMAPAHVYRQIWARMAEHGTYRGMIEQRPRCIRVQYANEFHLDIVPAIPDPVQGGNNVLVPDLDTDLRVASSRLGSWKPSNPKDYKLWFDSRCAVRLMEKYARIDPVPDQEPVHRKPPLKRVVQLWKRWRDIAFRERAELEPPSIILTTLAGHYYNGETLCSAALGTIIERVTADREAGIIPCQRNPANPKEVICERWRDRPESLDAFDRALARLRKEWAHIRSGRGLAQTAERLKRLFGEHVVDESFRELTEEHVNRPRRAGRMVMDRASRRIGQGTSNTPIGFGSAFLPVTGTTFHGD